MIPISNGVESETIVQNDPSQKVLELRALLNKNPTTSVHQLEDKFLIKFLRSRKNDVEKSYELIVQYLAKVVQRPDLFTWDPKIKEAVDSLSYNHYQHRSASGHRLILINPGKWSSKVDIDHLIKLSIIGQEINLMDDYTQQVGYMVIINVTGLGLSQIYRCGIANARLISDLTDHCMPIRLEKIHIIFENRLVDIAFSLFKPFLDQELKEKIVFHGHSLSSLHEYCHPSSLPASLGGHKEEPDPEVIWKMLLDGKDDVQAMWDRIKQKAIESDDKS